MSELTEFLLARFDEQSTMCSGTGEYGGCDDLSEWAERSLAAMRRIVEIHRPSRADSGFLPYCEGCWEDGGMDGAPTHPCRTLRALATVYADRPDCKEEWKP